MRETIGSDEVKAFVHLLDNPVGVKYVEASSRGSLRFNQLGNEIRQSVNDKAMERLHQALGKLVRVFKRQQANVQAIPFTLEEQPREPRCVMVKNHYKSIGCTMLACGCF